MSHNVKDHLRHVRSGAPSPAPSAASANSRRTLPTHPGHVHAQHSEIFVPPDEIGADVVGLAGATAGFVQQVEDAVEDEDEADRRYATASYPYRGSDDEATEQDALLDGTRDRRRSVTWVDQSPSSAGKASLVVPEVAVSPSPFASKTASDSNRDPRAVSPASTSATDQDGVGHGDVDVSVDWTALRDGSISRRPRWRRPGPGWLLPFIFLFAVAFGMGAAPKQELLINLACLAHPPRSQSAASRGDVTVFDLAKTVWRMEPAVAVDGDHRSRIVPRSSLSSSNFTAQPMQPAVIPLTPADKWMLELQRRIAEDERKKRMSQQPSAPGSPVVIGPSGVPIHHVPSKTYGPSNTATFDLPLPSGPIGGMPSEDTHHRQPSSNHGGSGADNGPPPGHWDEDDEIRPGEIDPRLCKKDPKTQAAAAKLTMAMTLSMGMLSAMTTGYWGSLSDRYGRTKVMAVALCGLIVNEIVLIIVATFPHKVPGGYRFLILGPVIDGLLGGMSTIQATNNAYLSDSTPDGSRAKMFGRFQGILMCGFSLGPVLGSILIRATGNILSVFYVGVCLFLTFLVFVLYVIPESLSSEARAALANAADAKALRARQKEQAEREWENESDDDDAAGAAGSSGVMRVPHGEESGWSMISIRTTATNASRRSTKRRKRLRGMIRRFRRRALGFARPLGLFIPKDKEYRSPSGNIVVRKDWNLTFLALGTFFAATLLGLLQLKAQFLIFRYGWSSVELGPYMTLLGSCRAAVLLILFPLVIKAFKPKLQEDQPIANEADGAAPPSGPGILRSRQALADARFDLRVIRISLLCDTFSYIAMSFLSPAPVFIFFTALVTLGSCTGSAQSSLALNLVDPAREAGRLFGAMSVLTAMSSTFLGPLVFSLVYANTVSVYAPAIFIVAVGMLIISQVCISLVRLPKLEDSSDVEVPRGRTRRPKRVKSSASDRTATL